MKWIKSSYSRHPAQSGGAEAMSKDAYGNHWPDHPMTCKCHGLGFIPIAGGICNCGSGEGCTLHNNTAIFLWVERVECPGLSMKVKRTRGAKP